MELDTKTRNTLRKAIPEMFQCAYSSEDTLSVFDDLVGRNDDHDIVIQMPEELRNKPREHPEMAQNSLLAYVNSDKIALRGEDVIGLDGLIELVPIAWGLSAVKRQAHILGRRNRPLNRPEGIYKRERDAAIRKMYDRINNGQTNDFAELKLIALAYQGKQPWTIDEHDLL